MRIIPLLLAVGAGMLLGAAATLPRTPSTDRAWSAESTVSPEVALERSIRRLRPAVVLVDVDLGEDEATGTGFVVQSGGYVLTNQHVIQDAHHISIRLASGRRLPAQLIHSDPEADLALLHVDAKGLPVATLADSDRVTEGEQVGVIGYPLPDTLADEGFPAYPSTTHGIVNAIRPGVTEIHRLPMTFFQTDARINDGNSGGPMFAADTGAVIGIVQSEIGEQTGINLAIPSNVARRFLKSCGITPSG